MNLFNLFAKITLDNSEYEAKMKDSQKTASSFSSKIGTAFKAGAKAVTAFATTVVAGAAALSGLAVKMVDFGSEIDDNAQKLGMSTEGYQYWSLVLQRAGSDASSMSMAIRTMSQFTEQLATGNGDALLSLQKLGIGYEDFMAMSTEEQLYAIVTALQGVENQTDKVALAQDILGTRTYQEFMPLLNMQQGSLEDLKDEFEGLGLIIEEDTIKQTAALGDKFDNLTNTIKISAFSMATELLPEITLITDGLMGLANGSDDAMQSLSDGLVGLISKVQSSIPTIIDTAGNLLLNIIEGMVTVYNDSKIINAITNVAQTLLLKFVEIFPSLIKANIDMQVALINGLLGLNWGDIIISLLDALLEIVLIQLPQMSYNIFFALIDTIIGLFSKDGLESLKEFGLLLAESIINGLISGVEAGLNLVIKAINKVLSKISNAWDWTGVIPSIPDIPLISIPRVDFAEGGMFDGLGTMYLARAGESGAEIVAQGSRGTGVANVEQIADAQYMAMRDYNLDGIINKAAANIVNGVVMGLRMNGTGTNAGGNVIVKIGEREFKSYIVQTVNDTLKAQGRKSLNTVTAYGGGRQ